MALNTDDTQLPEAGDAVDPEARIPASLAAAETSAGADAFAAEPVAGSRTRRRLLVGVASILVLALLASAGLFYRYVTRPQPLPDLLLPQVKANYPPHYLSSIYGPSKPVGVAISQDGRRIYVAESGGERLVKVFDREGKDVGRLAPPSTSPGERAPVYVATDAAGRVYVTDRLQFAVFVYGPDGSYLDTLLSPDLALSAYIAGQAGDYSKKSAVSYNVYQDKIRYQPEGEAEKDFALPKIDLFAPLGIRIAPGGRIYLTDVTKNHHRIVELALGDFVSQAGWAGFKPEAEQFGASGQGDGQVQFPNAAMPDSQGRVYVADGNNGRIAVWDKDRNFLYNFAFGAADGAVSLPRGLFVDKHDRLYVVDAVGQGVRVYDVSGKEPAYLFSFGDIGDGDGLFNYPSDITVDDSGRLYVADRDNDRVQVWSY